MKILQISRFYIDKHAVNHEREKLPLHSLLGYDFLNERFEVDLLWPNRENKVVKLLAKILGDEIYRIILQLKCILKSGKYDLIYSPHDIHIFFLAFFRLIKICRSPIVMVCHFTYNTKFIPNNKTRFIKKFVRTFIYKGIDRILFANKLTMDIAAQDFEIPQRHLNYISWGGDTKYYNPRYFNSPPTNDYYLAAGSTNRDYDTLIKAFAKLNNIKLVISDRNISRTSYSIPNVSYDDLNNTKDRFQALRKYYYNATAILLPIKEINDVPNGSTTILEALAMGKPIVLTDIATNYIDVEKEGVGMKVGIHDIDGWIKAISYIETHPNEAKEMGVKALQLAQQLYNYELFCENLLSHINDFNPRRK